MSVPYPLLMGRGRSVMREAAKSITADELRRKGKKVTPEAVSRTCLSAIRQLSEHKTVSKDRFNPIARKLEILETRSPALAAVVAKTDFAKKVETLRELRESLRRKGTDLRAYHEEDLAARTPEELYVIRECAKKVLDGVQQFNRLASKVETEIETFAFANRHLIPIGIGEDARQWTRGLLWECPDPSLGVYTSEAERELSGFRAWQEPAEEVIYQAQIFADNEDELSVVDQEQVNLIVSTYKERYLQAQTELANWIENLQGSPEEERTQRLIDESEEKIKAVQVAKSGYADSHSKAEDELIRCELATARQEYYRAIRSQSDDGICSNADSAYWAAMDLAQDHEYYTPSTAAKLSGIRRSIEEIKELVIS